MRKTVLKLLYNTKWLIYMHVQVLSVQVPFFFKSIIDSMNVDFLAMGGTVWTVAGSMIVACVSISYTSCFASFPRPSSCVILTK